MADDESRISFKSRKVFRRRKSSIDSEDENETQEQVSSILEEAKELQKLRKRQNGISATALALGKKVTQAQEFTTNDPFKWKTGGLVDMKQIKDRNRDRSGEEDNDTVNLGTTFSAETNRRDEDADMMKYIDEQLALRKGVKTDGNKSPDPIQEEKIIKPEDALFELPEYLRKSSSKKSEEMLSNQMLSGIPEVDLGIEAKIRNIEATEDAKQKLMAERMNKKDKPSEFVPTNMAVNFVQHNRFNIEETEAGALKRVKEAAPKRKLVVVGDVDNATQSEPAVSPPKKKAPVDEKATDDFHFEKFKKQFRRY